MNLNQDPRWLNALARRLQWLAIPNIAIILVTLQALGFLLVLSNSAWMLQLALDPQLVLRGEFWRVLTFLAVPVSLNPIWMLISLWFLYFIVNLIESEWGAFKTTLYVLVSYALTVAFAFVFNYSVYATSDFIATLFLAAAALYPNFEVRLYFLIPVKMKWLGWLTLGFLALRLIQGGWIDRLYLTAIYSNYLLFFGPVLFARIRDWKRRQDYKRKFDR